MLLKWY